MLAPNAVFRLWRQFLRVWHELSKELHDYANYNNYYVKCTLCVCLCVTKPLTEFSFNLALICII